MTYKITSGDLEHIDLSPETETDEILQNVMMFSATTYGTCPMNREFGVGGKHLGHSIPVAKAYTKRDLFLEAELRETRCELLSVAITEIANGKIRSEMEVSI